jgi:hypothetical protein
MAIFDKQVSTECTLMFLTFQTKKSDVGSFVSCLLLNVGPTRTGEAHVAMYQFRPHVLFSL